MSRYLATSSSQNFLQTKPYVPLQRNYSKNTIYSYRDTLKLFVRFITFEKGIKLNKFTLSDFNRQLVLEFFDWYRQSRASSSSANQRLAAIKSFSDYAQIENVEYMSTLQGVITIKAKKSQPKEISFLSVGQMTALINQPDINTPAGLRHRTVLTFLYDSGCRVLHNI